MTLSGARSQGEQDQFDLFPESYGGRYQLDLLALKAIERGSVVGTKKQPETRITAAEITRRTGIC